ncbi:LacI family DNA-binding transcriptional regulator [Clostridium paraputrificum]|uniref:Catabolite control protein A n=1 Tax=Clostridium paraputrificum TaxID=29363 RepID=A0A6N3C5Z0_9CLOT
MKKATMKDIANKLNISINAVSLALNSKAGVSEETRKIVFDTANEIGYLEKSNKFIKTYASKNICVLIRKLYFEDNYFYSKILMGVVEESRKNGYDIITSIISENDMSIPTCIENEKVCGVIVIGAIDDEYLIRLKENNIPVVLVDYESFVESTDCILTDNKYGSFSLAKLLFDRGYRKIGFFGELAYSLSVKERFFGYSEAIKKFVQFSNRDEFLEYINNHSILDDIEGYIINQDTDKIVEKLRIIKEMPEAFVCSNDNAAILLISALEQLGYSVPADISVVGFDNIAISSLVVPNITTVSVEKELMGRKALQRLLWRLDNKGDMNECIVMGVTLIERDSVGFKKLP